MNDRDPFRLDGKVAIVTGAGRGIGAAIALEVAEAGADVGLIARSKNELEEIAAQIRAGGRRAAVVAEDLSTNPDLEAIVARVVTEFGSVDLLVNNAGGAMPASFVETSPVQLEDALRFNVVTPFALVKAAVPHLLRREGSSVINVSSNLDHHAPRGHLVYGTAKAALSHLTRLLAADLAPRVRVNAVAPGVVETAGVASALGDEIRQRIIEVTPLRRLAHPQDVARAVRWLASSASSLRDG